MTRKWYQLFVAGCAIHTMNWPTSHSSTWQKEKRFCHVRKLLHSNIFESGETVLWNGTKSDCVVTFWVDSPFWNIPLKGLKARIGCYFSDGVWSSGRAFQLLRSLVSNNFTVLDIIDGSLPSAWKASSQNEFIGIVKIAWFGAVEYREVLLIADGRVSRPHLFKFQGHELDSTGKE